MRSAFDIPKQPVLDGSAFRYYAANLPCLLDLPARTLTRSGRSAITLALTLIGIKPGDRVLLPTYHCPTMIAPVEALGGTPLFYPLSTTGTPELSYLVRSDLSGVRAMILSHFFGLPRDISPSVEFCRLHRIPLIEDCAHAFFGMAGDRPIGASGDFAIGSLPKFFPVIEGGILASASRPLPSVARFHSLIMDELRAAWDLLDIAGRSGRLGAAGALARQATGVRRRWLRRSPATGTTDAVFPTSEQIRDSALTDPLLMPASLRRTESWFVRHSDHAASVRRRQQNFRTMARELAGLERAHPLFEDCGNATAPYVFPLLIANPDGPYAQMRSLGLPVYRWDRVWPSTPAFDHDIGASWARQVIQVVCHQSLTDSEVHLTCRQIRHCLDK
jgi:dTDP-4-amino-4,6-dideoxygalactose transaminase